ncbi:MAG: DUF4910 domain-containing protein [Francisellaceae bacterium]|jgi:hypothetical protein|nr:DUF4910 domain-containing protein [Francisellaceae bacterium]
MIVKYNKINKVILFGGAPLLVSTVKYLQEVNLDVLVYTSPRHAAEVLGCSGVTLKQSLDSLGVRYYSVKDINSDESVLSEITSNTLGIGMGEAWSFCSDIINKFGGMLLDFMGIPHPRYRGGAHYTKNFRTEPFRKVVGNDETCWDSVGYEIPCPSLSRSNGVGHFPEYHTSKDSPDLIEMDMMEESVNVVMETFFAMENDMVMKYNSGPGLVALSHPKYDLYKPMFDPSEPGRKTITQVQRNWNYLMDCLPRYFDGKTRIIEIANKHKISFREVYNYIQEFIQRGLVIGDIVKSTDNISMDIPPF